MQRKPRGRPGQNDHLFCSCAKKGVDVGASVVIHFYCFHLLLDWIQPRPNKEWWIFFLSGEHQVRELSAPYTEPKALGGNTLLLAVLFREVAASTSRCLWAPPVVFFEWGLGHLLCSWELFALVLVWLNNMMYNWVFLSQDEDVNYCILKKQSASVTLLILNISRSE